MPTTRTGTRARSWPPCVSGREPAGGLGGPWRNRPLLGRLRGRVTLRLVKRLLLLGGGHAHVHLLREMARERFAPAEVALVTPFMRQIYSGMVPGVVAGHYPTEKAAILLPPLAAAAGVTILETAAVGLDAPRRQVRLADGRLVPYDVLSIDTGSVMDRGHIAGARQHASFVRPIEHFLGDVDELLDRAAQRALDVVVIGGGAAGVELALALQHRLSTLAKAGASEAGRVALVLSAARPLAGYPEAVVHHAERALARARITLFRDACVEVRAECVVLATGARLACDAALLATGPEAPAWLAGSGLALDGHGFVVTGPTLQSGSHAEVFAVGDVASRIDAPHPRSGVYAVRAGPPLLANLRAFASGAPLKRYMPPQRTLNLISCGQRRAIASRGGWSAEGRWVWWWKNHIDSRFVARFAMRGAQPQPVSAKEVATKETAAAVPPIPSA
jgi:pyridine nucleotide-disulfide oxidoreductase family protein